MSNSHSFLRLQVFHRRLFSSVVALALAVSCLSSVTALAQKGSSSPLRIQYYFPLNGSQSLPRECSIIIRPGDALLSSSISASYLAVKGSLSGTHTGSFTLSDDHKTLLFKPAKIFTYGERVDVALRSGIRTLTGMSVDPIAFSFTIIKQSKSGSMALQMIEPPYYATSAMSALKADVPQLRDDLPALLSEMQVTSTGAQAPGKIFFAPFNFYGSQEKSYRLITLDTVIDTALEPVYIRESAPRLSKGLPAGDLDFRPQPNGDLTFYESGSGQFIELDHQYKRVDTWAADGYPTDLHELRLLPNGHALLLSYDTLHHKDMSKYVKGGNPDADFIQVLIQEIDKSKKAVVTWRSVDHYSDTDATNDNFKGVQIDPVHANAIEMDGDTAILLSSRSMDEITKIRWPEGDIIWRLGGKHNQFTFIGDSLNGFSHQHAVRRLPNGHITVFDNGNFPPGRLARGLEYSLDEVNKTATLVWSYIHHAPDIISQAMGFVQRQPNGNTLISWGLAVGPTGLVLQPAITEVTPKGDIAWELSMPSPYVTYRAERAPWDGPVSEVQPTVSAATLAMGEPYPNPATSMTAIGLDIPVNAPVTLEMYNALGVCVRTIYRNAPVQSSVIEIPTADLANGTYRLLLSDGLHQSTRKLVVLH